MKCEVIGFMDLFLRREIGTKCRADHQRLAQKRWIVNEHGAENHGQEK